LELSAGTVRQALTNPFGYYRFENITAGTKVFLSVNAKGHTFSDNPRVVTAADKLAAIDFLSSL
jgi:hypothetical protein